MKKILFAVIILAGFMIGAVSPPLVKASECELKVCDIYCCQKSIKEHRMIIAYQEMRLRNEDLKDGRDYMLDEDLRKSIQSLKQRIINLRELIAIKTKRLERPCCR